MAKFLSMFAAAALTALTVSSALADEVITNEGDHITGTITKVQDGKMTVHSSTLSDVVIPLSHIRTFSTDSPIELHLTDGTVVNRQVAQSDPGQVAIVGAGLGAGQQVPVSSIDEVNPQPLTGSFQIGGSLTRGNTFTDTINAGFNLGYKIKQEQILFTGEYEYGRTKDRATGTTLTTEDRWDLDGKYEHFFSKRFYGYVEAEVTKDRIAFLDLRFTPSAGLGYAWFDKSPLFFSTEGGIAWIYENYTNGTPNREEVGLKLAYHLKYDFNPNVQLFNDVTYFPSLEYGSNYLLNTDVGLHAKLTKQLFAEFKIEWDFDSHPANGALKNDERYIASLGYSL